MVVPPGTREAYEANRWTGFKNTIENFIVDNVEYSIVNVVEQTVATRTYLGTDTELVFSATVTTPQGADFTIVHIGDNTFNSKGLTSITLPEGLTSIGDQAFKNNALTAITLPEGLTSIGSQAFLSNSLTSVTLPEGLTSIGDEAFAYNSLASITFPEGLTHIGEEAFRENSLTGVTLPEGITTIPQFSFKNNKFSSYTIPSHIESIGKEAFYKSLGFKRMSTAMAIFENQPQALEWGLVNES